MWGPKSLVKIGSVTAEIFLIWINVTRTYFYGQMSLWQLVSVKDGPRNLPLKFGQNRVAAAEIFLIWTNVVGTNVVWTNVIVTVGIWLRWSQKSNLKFGQNGVSSSWDIPDMDKCRCDKCCLDKYYCDSWNLFKIVSRTYLQSLVKIG